MRLTPISIGNITTENNVFLAPLAGYTNYPFRRLCKGYGAGLCYTEMVSAKGLCMCDRKSRELLKISEVERPCAAQLFGDDPDIMAKAASIAMTFSPDMIDINMGCPAPKIAGNHCGSALMRDPDLCRRIVEAMAKEVNVPVTAKIRKGFDPRHVNAVEVALAVEAGGAAAVGCCAQMVGFAVMSFRENRWGGLVSQGIGTSMLQMGNIIKNPRIWIPPTLASAITGPLATCLFKMQMNGAMTAGK